MLNPASLTQFLEAQFPAALEMLRQMVGINSFTLNRAGLKQLGHFTADAFAPLGFTAEFVPSTNPKFGEHLVLTRRGHGPKNLALISHLDTVFPPEEEARNDFRWQVEGDRIFGPGTQDIKGGTVMIWLVLKALQAHAPKAFEGDDVETPAEFIRGNVFAGFWRCLPRPLRRSYTRRARV